MISQIYGGGGNAGAPLRADFIEIFNRSNQPISVTGWTIQYASASGTSWDRTDLLGTMQPGQYYLIQETVGSIGASIPTADASGAINLSAMSGKIALVAGSAVLSGSSPSGPQTIDFVGYGTANAAETSAAHSLDNVTAILRHSNGCTDTNNNATDFVTGSPSPRNSKSPLNPCSPALPQGPTISTAGITNAADFQGGAIAPGEILTIFGSGMGPPALQSLQLAPDGRAVTNSLGGTRVLFAGNPGPLIYTQAEQLSVVAPYSIAGNASVDIQVEYNGRLSNTINMPVTRSAPGIFTANSSGKGQGAILNQDNSVNSESHSAERGSIIVIYATGGGQTNPVAPDGAITSTPFPLLRETVAVRIDGMDAEVLYAGMAPQLVNGVVQINARVPTSLTRGGPLPIDVRVGNSSSQSGVTVAVEGPSGDAPGTGPLIEQRLAELRFTAFPSPLPEIPNDRVGLPRDWLGLISWNTQVGATSVASDAARPPMVSSALANLFSGTYQILAAQEVPNSASANLLTSLLPGGITRWQQSFFDSTDSMDNGFWFQRGTILRDAFLLNVTDQTHSGEIVTDPAKALHPPQVAQFEIDDFDFTLITVHLTFADGDTAESARELRSVLDYLDWYFAQANHDPDVILCGDFNTPSTLSKQQGRAGLTVDSAIGQDSRFQQGERRFVVTVHEPTSRSSAANGGLPANNYDHCVLSANTLKAFIQARRIDTSILTDSPEDPELRLTSDHFPIVAFFRTRGPGILLDRKLALRPPN